MPIKIQNDLPVKEILERENIFVMDENRSFHQDIRPLKILILNLMPLKEETRASAPSIPLQYAAAGGYYIYACGEPRVKKYFHEPSE